MSCIINDKSFAPLDKLENVGVVGSTSGFEIFWGIEAEYPEQSVQMIYRLANNTDEFVYVPAVLRDDGSVATDVLLPEGIVYTVWIRPEIAGHYGAWQSITAITTDSIEGYKTVVHGADIVLMDSDTVIIPE